MSTSDKVQNMAEQAKGKAKEAIGVVSDDAELKREGRKDERTADLKQVGEKIKDALTD